MIEKICARRSVSPKHLAAPGPAPEQIREMVRAACAGPDHGRLAPTRFVYLPDDQRDTLADIFVAAAKEADSDASAEYLASTCERALNGPCLIAVIARIVDDNPQVLPYEQWIAVGAALQNLLLASESFGFRGKTVSGARVRSRTLRNAFVLSDAEHLVGFVALGTYTGEPKQMPRRSPDEVLGVFASPVGKPT
jgi:nitroreductase